VLQYKKKCGEVEQQLLEKATELEQERLTVRDGFGEPPSTKAAPPPPNWGDGERADVPTEPAGCEQLAAGGGEQQRAGERLDPAGRGAAEVSGGLRGAVGPPTPPWGDAPATCDPPHPRSSSLVQVNSMLREQLEQANVANAALSEDIRKLTADWARARDELEQREAEWRREEEVWGGPGVCGGNPGIRQGAGWGVARRGMGGSGMQGCGVERGEGMQRGMQDHQEGCGAVLHREEFRGAGDAARGGRGTQGRRMQRCGLERDVGPRGGMRDPREGCGTPGRDVGPRGMLHGEEFGGVGDAARDGRAMHGRGLRPPCPSPCRAKGSWGGGAADCDRPRGLMGAGWGGTHATPSPPGSPSTPTSATSTAGS